MKVYTRFDDGALVKVLKDRKVIDVKIGKVGKSTWDMYEISFEGNIKLIFNEGCIPGFILEI